MSDQLFDRAVRDWLEDGSDRTPRPAIDAVLLAVKTTPQERTLRIPRRFKPMPVYLRLATLVALVALGVGTVTYFGGNSRIGPPTPTASPSAMPTATPIAAPPVSPTQAGPLDTTDWQSFTSTRYGFSIKHPADWVEVPATHHWTLAKDFEAWTSKATESFYTTRYGTGVQVSIWAARVAPGTTATSAFSLPSSPWPLGDGFFPLAVLVARTDERSWTREGGLPPPNPPIMR